MGIVVLCTLFSIVISFTYVLAFQCAQDAINGSGWSIFWYVVNVLCASFAVYLLSMAIHDHKSRKRSFSNTTSNFQESAPPLYTMDNNITRPQPAAFV